MSTNKPHFILITILTICLFLSVSKAQTITSTSTGGAWGSTATWVGGVVPSAGNNVVIAGEVIYQNGAGSCNNLTINAGASLYNQTGYAWGEQILTVNGNVTNNGIIRSQSNLFVLKIKGSITNNGTWTFKRTELIGSGTQTLSTTNQSKFENPFLVDAASKPTVAAGSNLIFTSSFDLSNSTFDAKSFEITLSGSSASITNGKVITNGIIKGIPSSKDYPPILNNITYEGNFTTKGRLSINSTVTFSGSVVNADTLENSWGYAHPEKILKVIGNLENKGLVRDYYSNGFVINLTGNLNNSGNWILKRTELSGNTDQSIVSTTGKVFESYFLVTDAVGKLIAGSDLIFTKAFDLNKCYLEMNSYTLTLKGSGSGVTNGNVTTNGIVYGIPSSTDYPPILNNITYNGTFTIKGRLSVNSTVTFSGSVVNTDTLENSWGYAHPEKILKVIGNFENKGLVRDYYSNGFVVNLTGNLVNRGNWAQKRTELSGNSNQLLTLSAGKIFDSYFVVTDSTGFTKAGSNLTFTKNFNLNKTVFDAENFSLTLLGGSANISNGIVINIKDLIGEQIGGNYPIVENIIYDGNLNLRGLLRINSGVTIKGNVTLTDTLQNSAGYAHPEKVLKIIGNFINNGLPRDGGSNGFVLDITGNITSNKPIANKRVQLAGTGGRNISDKISSVSFQSTGEKVILTGENYLPNLSISASSKCQLSKGAKIFVPGNNLDERLDNWSEISITRKMSSPLVYSFFKSSIKLVAESKIDSVKIQSFGHQVPSTFANAVKCWWRLLSFAKTSSVPILSSLTMIYNDDLLGNNIESGLQVYQSLDSGKTWKQISISTNTTRDLANNSITVSDVPAYGDYLLSSSPDPYSVRASVIGSIIGRENIRVGVPNRYSIHYVNNSDVETGDMLMQIKTTDRISIKQVEPSMPAGVSQQVYKMDKLTVETQDSVAMLWVTSMAPREERTLNIVLTPMPGINKISEQKMFLPLIILAIEVVGTAIVVDYTADVIGTVGKELWRPVPLDCASLLTAFKNAVLDGIGKTNYEWFGYEKPMGTISEEAAQKLIEKAGFESVDKVATAKKIYEATQKQVEGMKDYVEGKSEVLDCGGNKKKLIGEVSSTTKSTKNVYSWDPNEKIGPNGFGDKKYITSAGKMTYQILFENKKEATAPVWRVFITDTLAEIFDPESFEFGATSHDGPQYNWVKTRNGNIVTWEIEGIELPPNVNAPEGEGYVMFTVNTKPNLPSGTEIKNSATIIFDMNKPIQTNSYINTLDFKPPVTKMNAIAGSMHGNRLTVRWKSEDGIDGSGVESIAVYMSVDDETYKLAGVSNSDSLAVSILPGTHSYSFYALARDNVGNIEVEKPETVSTSFTNSVEQSDDELPFEYKLSQNYPNPFNPATTISFSIPVEGIVTLKVYNVLGQEVVTLVNEVLRAGNYKTLWNAKNISSGIYFYRLETANFNQTKKLLLLK